MEISGYELIGFLGIAILTIEVAVYAIIVSLASRITRVTEEEIDDRISGYEKDLKKISKVVGEGEGRISQEEICEIQKRIDDIKASEKEREELRESIKIENALLKPVIPSAAAVIIIVCTLLFMRGNFAILGLVLSFVGILVSVLLEIPVLKTIGRTASFEEYNPYSELKKVMDDIQKTNFALTTEAISAQTKTFEILIGKQDELISAIYATLGNLEPNYGVQLFDDERNELSKLVGDVDDVIRVALNVTNNSEFVVLGARLEINVPEEITFTEMEYHIDNWDYKIAVRQGYVDSKPGGERLRVLLDELLCTLGFSLRPFKIKGAKKGIYEVDYSIMSKTHKPLDGTFIVEII